MLWESFGKPDTSLSTWRKFFAGNFRDNFWRTKNFLKGNASPTTHNLSLHRYLCDSVAILSFIKLGHTIKLWMNFKSLFRNYSWKDASHHIHGPVDLTLLKASIKLSLTNQFTLFYWAKSEPPLALNLF